MNKWVNLTKYSYIHRTVISYAIMRIFRCCNMKTRHTYSLRIVFCSAAHHNSVRLEFSVINSMLLCGCVDWWRPMESDAAAQGEYCVVWIPLPPAVNRSPHVRNLRDFRIKAGNAEQPQWLWEPLTWSFRKTFSPAAEPLHAQPDYAKHLFFYQERS